MLFHVATIHFIHSFLLFLTFSHMSHLHHTSKIPNLWKISTIENKRKKASFFRFGKKEADRLIYP